MRIRRLVVLLAMSIDATARAAKFAFIDVNVVPMDREIVLAHQTVIVTDGRIREVGPVGLAIPDGARRIDGRGRYLLPGLTDMHAHFVRPPSPGRKDEALVREDYLPINEAFGRLFIANGVTSVRVLWGHPETDRLAARFARGDLPGPFVYSTGPVTDGDPPEIAGARTVTTLEQARAAVRADKADGRVAIKLYDLLTPESWRDIMQAARDADLPVVGHVPFAVSAEEVIRGRYASIEHVDGFLDALQPEGEGKTHKKYAQMLRDADLSKLDPLAQLMKENGVALCPTIVVFQMDWSKERARPEMKYLPEDVSRRVIEHYSAANFPDGDLEIAYGIAVVKRMHAAGVRLLAGSDEFKPNVVPGFSLIDEIGYLHRAGLSNYEAVAAATVEAARSLRRETEFGSVRVGARGDLLLLAGNPLTDLGALRKRIGVLAASRWYEGEELLRVR